MKEALLLLNMGGPENEKEIRMFLSNMFNDKNILSIPGPIRKLVASLITWRRATVAKANYDRIGGASPLMGHTRRLQAKLQARVAETCRVEPVMRYTPPRATEVLAGLQAEGIERLLLLPLYPQYSTTTTRSSLEDIEAALEALHYRPDVRTLERFFDHPDYIAALNETITDALGPDKAEEFELIYSAHGLPQKVIDRGDPYEKEIHATVKASTEALKHAGVHFGGVTVAYQSKVGPMKWLEPSLEKTLEGMKGKRVIIVPVSFTVDNSETDFELSIEYKEEADAMGLDDYRVCRCPNDSDTFVTALTHLYQELKA